MIVSTVALLLVLGCLPSTAVTAPTTQDEPQTPKDAAAAIESALRKGENPGVALKQAEALRDAFDDKAFAPVVKAAGLAFKNDKRIPQCLVMETYAVLSVPGSTKQFAQLLEVPEHVEGTLLRNTYALAIETAGKLHEKEALKSLEALLVHPDTRFARTAAEALAGYVDLPKKDMDKLLKRLVKTLDKAERKLGNKQEDLAKHAAVVTTVLDATLGTLSGVGAAAGGAGTRSADDWKPLLAERARKK